MKKVIVLIMHGMAPKDFPEKEKVELMRLNTQIASHANPDLELKKRYDELDRKMRHWSRTPVNDPYHAASYEMAKHLEHVTATKVIVGFGEFCWPYMEDAMRLAVKEGPEKIVVITPMLTRGGNHSGTDIPEAVDRVQKENPQISFIYAWPFETGDIANFLAAQIKRVE